jgi:hypothetical protein
MCVCVGKKTEESTYKQQHIHDAFQLPAITIEVKNAPPLRTGQALPIEKHFVKMSRIVEVCPQ